MNKTSVVLTIAVSLCISLAFGVQLIDLGRANPISVPSVPSIRISYPLHSIGGYVNSTVEFEVTVNMPIESLAINNISYSLDGGTSVNLVDLKITTSYDDGPTKMNFKTYKANILLTQLSEGNHTLIAAAGGMSDSEAFVVNSNYHITALNVLSPNDQMYSATTVPLTFTYTGDIKNAHYYLYRFGELVSERPLSGDLTFNNLSDGSYDLYVYVTTQYGQDAKTIHFSILGIPTIVGVTALLIVLSVISLVYFKKFKRKNQ